MDSAALFFARSWRLSRRILHKRDRVAARFRGVARFHPLGGADWAYEESGTMTWGGRAFAASQRSLWRLDGARAAIRFADGRPFCAFDLAPGRWSLCPHLCGDDRYDGALRPEAGRWWWRWRVRGPAKDYVSLSLYLPETQAPGPCAYDAAPLDSAARPGQGPPDF